MWLENGESRTLECVNIFLCICLCENGDVVKLCVGLSCCKRMRVEGSPGSGENSLGGLSE